MRLLHVFPGFGVGGAQMRFCTLARRLDPAWQHDVIALDGDLACRERLAGAPNIGFPAVVGRGRNPLRAVRHARAVLCERRPDVLVTYNWGAMDWAIANALVGLRHVHLEDGFGPEERSRQLPRRVWTRRLVLRRATVVLPSRTLLRIATDIWRLPPARLRYIPNGIDLARFAGCAPMSWPGTGPVIGTVAALRPEKNVGRLLEAFARLRCDRPARLVIVGDGPQRPALEQLAATLGIADAVHFAGHLSAPEAAYAGFDIFALTSDTEQMPLSVLEAVAASRPVVATDVGDIATMLADTNRRFVTPPDPAALADALRALLDAPDLRVSIGVANRLKAEQDYDEAVMVRAHAAALSQ